MTHTSCYLVRSTVSRTSQRNHVPDVAHHAPTLPVPTLVTPLNVPSPSHSRADTPLGMPVAHPPPRSLDDGEVPPPVPIHERAPSPAHPPVDIPPDGWIPLATGPNEEIFLPPPHELSRPVTPVSPTPPPPPILQPAEPSQPAASSSAMPPPPQLISRDYPEIPPGGVSLTRSSASTRPLSPQSKASTTISQFDITNAPPRGQIRVSTSGRPPREDVRPPLRSPFVDANPRRSATGVVSARSALTRRPALPSALHRTRRPQGISIL